ncbi:hypothetical protein ACFFMN_09990 [Planobispora siamensis]|uniref:Uncharacterized protein n=1 Tax=Planobispora siamensis TaxID=936338 RepID=A0A8J3WKZ1_9ACTN|nr:hypothetical protein [Planobispora siamensis]GIH91321.1 hypothetical protein Psi01_19510 [Planobispora siamensis]
MLKPKTRGRVMAKTAAIAVVGAGVLFGAVPALASLVAAPKPVTYDCENSEGTRAAYRIQMDLTGPANPAPSSTIVATWKIGPSASPGMTAASAIPSSERIAVEADVLVTGSPVPSELRSAGATGTASAVPAGSTLQPPNVLITMTPTATGVIGIQPDGFTLYLAPTAGAPAGTEGELLTCTVATTASAEASAAALLITVRPSTANTNTGTPTPTNTGTGTGTPTPTATNTRASVKPTITVYETVTASSTRTRQIERTPGGGAATGGGGDAGPDARVIILSGTLMVAGAAVGGMVLRRRTAARG